MKKTARTLTALALALCLLAAPLGAQAADLPFTDLDGWEFSENYEYWCAALEYGFFYGTSPTTLSPARPVSRSEAITVLGRLHEKLTGEKIPEAGVNTFTDVPEGCYYEDYANWAQDMGVITGYGDGTFRPKRTVDSRELGVMFWRYLRAIGKDTLYEPARLSTADKAAIPAWAQPAAEVMRGFGIFYKDSFMEPHEISRGFAASYFVELYEKAAYVIDKETPQQKFRYKLSGDDEEDPYWVDALNCTVLESLEEYQDYLDSLRDPAWTHWEFGQMETPVPLEVDQQLFEEYNLLAINSINGGTNDYDFSSLEIEGETAHITLITNSQGSSVWGSVGVLTFLAVPKTVTKADVSWLLWTQHIVPT